MLQYKFLLQSYYQHNFRKFCFQKGVAKTASFSPLSIHPNQEEKKYIHWLEHLQQYRVDYSFYKLVLYIRI